jgi:L-aminopeptidase/D-esterase-like protein
MADGDTIFALSTGSARADLSVVGTAAAEVMAEAVVRAVKAAKDVAGVPGLAGK